MDNNYWMITGNCSPEYINLINTLTIYTKIIKFYYNLPVSKMQVIKQKTNTI